MEIKTQVLLCDDCRKRQSSDPASRPRLGAKSEVKATEFRFQLQDAFVELKALGNLAVESVS